ncbi:MAG: hypothetical protein U1C97_01945 [Candidatus Gracilibacteria bacterium]|nr:hypothetical protein [bacterium]MDZ4217060.1 hypothetical protein [Candidatus Gracilibacteria bacterium]
MTFTDLKELHSMDLKHLKKEAQKVIHFLNGIAFENSHGNLKDTSQLSKARKHLARIRTLQTKRKVETPMPPKAA